jgi:hypothetical protein
MNGLTYLILGFGDSKGGDLSCEIGLNERFFCWSSFWLIYDLVFRPVITFIDIIYNCLMKVLRYIRVFKS